MTNTFYVIDSSNTINSASSPALELTTGDDLYVMSGGAIISTTGTALYVDAYGGSDTIAIEGTVIGQDRGIDSLGQYANFEISGHVFGGSDTGMSVSNVGFVHISKTGLVHGGVEGMAISGSSEVVNDGTIEGGENDAIQLTSGFVVNNGLISDPFDAIFWGGEADARVTNTGTIQGNIFTWYGASDAEVSLTVDNSGDWYGNIGATGPGNNTITNTGLITGNITTGNGADQIDTHTGIVDGSISAGGGADYILAGAEDDVIEGGAGGDTMNGGAGNNTLSYQSSAHGVRVDLINDTATRGDAAGDKFQKFENVIGSFNRDVLTGDDQDNQLAGILGNDKIFGNGGNDSFVQYGTGTESLYGGDGNDSFQLITLDAVTYGQAFTANAKLDGGNGFDTIELANIAPIVFNASTMTNIERIQLDDGYAYSLTSHNATVANGATLDVDGSAVSGGFSVYFNGSAEAVGKFTFEGGAGNDTFIGGGGIDTLSGGAGHDSLTGGGAADVFAYDAAADSLGTAYDSVTDFAAGTDTFELDVAVNAVEATQTATASGGNLLARMHSACQGVMGAHEAVLVQITAGTLAGQTFLVVDANGTAGYQANDDYLINVTGITGSLTTVDFTVG